LNGFNRTLFAIVVCLVCIGGTVGCGNGDEGGANADGVKKLAAEPTETQNNNPDVVVDPNAIKADGDVAAKGKK
jgi:hypothetical protein